MIAIPPRPGQIWVEKRGKPRFIDILSIRSFGQTRFEIETCPIIESVDQPVAYNSSFISSNALLSHYAFCLDLHTHMLEWAARNPGWRPIRHDKPPIQHDIWRNNEDPGRFIRIMKGGDRVWYQSLQSQLWTHRYLDVGPELIENEYCHVVNLIDILMAIWNQILAAQGRQ